MSDRTLAEPSRGRPPVAWGATLAPAAAAGIALSVLAFLGARASEESEIRARFERAASSRVTALQLALTHMEHELAALEALLATADGLGSAEFRGVASQMMRRHGHTNAIVWAPRVAAAGRAVFERAGHTDGQRSIQVSEMDGDGTLRPATERPEYFPVLFVEPLAGNERVLGYDLASSAIRREALERARESGAATVTRRLKLIQEQGSQFGVLLVRPVIRRQGALLGDRERDLLGFVAGVYRLGDLVEGALAPLAVEPLEVELLDRDAQPHEQFLTWYSSEEASRSAPAPLPSPPNVLRLESSVEIGGRTWVVRCSPPSGFAAAGGTWKPWALLGAGISITGLLLGLVALLASNRSRLAAIRERQRRDEIVRRLAESSPLPMTVTVGLDGRFLMVNAKFQELFGYALEEIPDVKAWRRVAYPDESYRRAVRKAWRERFEARGSASGWGPLEETVTCKDGSIRFVSLHGTYVDGLELTIFVDLTEQGRAARELERAKEEAEAANRAKSSFLANISHEIRTPLNAILGYSQLMARDPELGASAKRNLEIINGSGEHLLALVNDVLEMSKIEAGRVSLDPATFDLHGMLGDLEAMFRLRTQRKGLSFEIARAEDVPRYVTADEGKVRQVLVNLLGNAVKFTREGGVTLGVSTSPDARGRTCLRAEVTDSGVGIRREEMGLLFRDFEQTESGRRLRSGTGLGLAISRGYARLMGGDVLVKSETGKGSVFSFEFPVEPGRPVASSAKGSQRRALAIEAGRPTPRVVLVDDEETNRDWLRQLLVAVGFEVREAADGLEAVEAWRAWKPDLVLMDIRMPVMNGREATRAIRGEAEGDRVVIVALTASALEEERKEMLECGADALLRKPVRETELLELIRARLGLVYVYDDAHATRVTASASAADQLTPAELASVPGETLKAMRAATRRGDIDRLHELIEQAAASSSVAASALRALAESFDYEALNRVLDGNEASNGVPQQPKVAGLLSAGGGEP